MSLALLVVDPDALKRALGIEDDDDSEDAALQQYEADAVAWVEGETHRRFQAPDDEHVEYRAGTNTRTLYLNGHVDDPDASVAVRERALSGGGWTALVEGENYERRRDTLVRIDGAAWNAGLEYEITYQDGYATAPQDIQALIIELVSVARSSAGSTASVVSGDAGLVSETIGEYSYKLDPAAAAAASASSSKLGTASLATIERWRRGRI